MPAGGANIASSVVVLPHSEFIKQDNFHDVCIRPLFAADECPASSAYGTARATTPLIDGALEGTVYLRPTSTPGYVLPDVVAKLKGPPSLPVEIDLVGHVDSVKGKLRTTFDATPDAPVSEFVLEMRGGKTRSLIENSENLCVGTHRFTAAFTAQNGKRVNLHTPVKTSCKKRKRSR